MASRGATTPRPRRSAAARPIHRELRDRNSKRCRRGELLLPFDATAVEGRGEDVHAQEAAGLAPAAHEFRRRRTASDEAGVRVEEAVRAADSLVVVRCNPFPRLYPAGGRVHGVTEVGVGFMKPVAGHITLAAAAEVQHIGVDVAQRLGPQDGGVGRKHLVRDGFAVEDDVEVDAPCYYSSVILYLPVSGAFGQLAKLVKKCARSGQTAQLSHGSIVLWLHL